jgi:phage terminase large subunit GpA-like protein
VIVDGSPAEAGVWSRLTELLGEAWPHACGGRLSLSKLAIDTGGHFTPEVYAWARRMGVAQVAAVKGVEGFNKTSPVSGPTFVDATLRGKRISRGARLWSVATATLKSETYRSLQLDRPTDEEIADGVAFPAGYVHLPRAVDSEWCKQLVAEQLASIKTKRGYTKLEWQKLRARNEALDCRVYARSALWIIGADRWPDWKWRALEAALGGPEHADAPQAPTAVAAARQIETARPAMPAPQAPRPLRRQTKVTRIAWLDQ